MTNATGRPRWRPNWLTDMRHGTRSSPAASRQLSSTGCSTLCEGYVRDFPCEQWVLCHGDLSPKHIFVTGDGSHGAAVRVSGIIDFGDWRPAPRSMTWPCYAFATRGWTCHLFSPATARRQMGHTGGSWTCTH